MATLREAETARDVHGDALAQGGAHAIGVEPGADYGHDGYVLVAYAEPGAAIKVPKTVHAGKGNAQVPVVVTRGGRFKPQEFKPESL